MVIEFVNPTEGYFHLSGIKLFKTRLDIFGDTIGFGGFRLRPVQVIALDDADASKDLIVKMYSNGNEQGEMIWNSEKQLHEFKWIGPALGIFNLTVTAEDLSGNIGYVEMDLWCFCFIPNRNKTSMYL